MCGGDPLGCGDELSLTFDVTYPRTSDSIRVLFGTFGFNNAVLTAWGLSDVTVELLGLKRVPDI